MCGTPGHMVKPKPFAVCINIAIVVQHTHNDPCLQISLHPILIFIGNQRGSKGVWYQIKAVACPWVSHCACVCRCGYVWVGVWGRESASPLWLPIKAGLAFTVGVQCLSDHVFVKHLLPCENPSQLLVHCSISGKKKTKQKNKQFRACCCSVQVCLCHGSVLEKKSEERWRERRKLLRGSSNV